MIKFKLYYDKDAETKWLNEMSAEGWAMTKFFAGFYFFESCEKGKYTYQVDLGDRFFDVSADYREFMQETGVEVIQPWGYWIFVRKLASEGEFELYTDVDSSIEHYSKIRKMFKVCTIIELVCFFIEILAGINGFYAGYAFAFLLAAIIVAFINIIIKTNHVIGELMERKGEMTSEKVKPLISPILAVGFLLNACALMIRENSELSAIKLGLQIAAIVFLLAGAFLTVKNGYKKSFRL